MNNTLDLKAFEAKYRQEVPLIEAMQLSLSNYDNLTLTMEAPLAPNINNKGTAFGGSIASICLFGGWAAITLAAMEHGLFNTETVVFKSQMTFEKPAKGHLVIKVRISPKDFENCLTRLKANDPGRIKLNIDADVFHENIRCATMSGLYVVWLK